MRVAIVDFGGYAFPLQLSRELARRGHAVLHVYCAEVAGSKNAGAARADDPPGLTLEPVHLGEPFDRYRFFKRRRQEIELGRLSGRLVAAFKPDVAVSCNATIDFLEEVMTAAAKAGATHVYWLQDIMSVVIKSVIASRYFGAGRAVAAYYAHKERRLFRRSDAVVAIAPGFVTELVRFGLPAEKCHLIPNWAPLEDIPALPKDNEWSRRHGLGERPVLLYSGALGLKHNPDVLVGLARTLRNDGSEAAVVVVSQGLGADALARVKQKEDLPNLILLGYQPIETLPQVLASADILLALLEPEAATYSVPSKVLSYFCAGRPVLLSVPKHNAIARIVLDERLGAAAEPGDTADFNAAAGNLLANGELRQAQGARARAYADEHFDISKIARRFEDVFAQAVAHHNTAYRWPPA